MLAAGAQVVLVTAAAGPPRRGAAVVFDWDGHVEERPTRLPGLPVLRPGLHAQPSTTRTLVRYYEDSTWLTTARRLIGQSSVDEGITPATAAAMARCGVDLTRLRPVAPRRRPARRRSVWSWATDEPAATGDCSVQRADGRFEARGCGESHPAACRTAGGAWTVTEAFTVFSDAAAACTAAGATLAVPRTGYENQLLKAAAAGATPWLGYVRDGAGWRALDAR